MARNIGGVWPEAGENSTGNGLPARQNRQGKAALSLVPDIAFATSAKFVRLRLSDFCDDFSGAGSIIRGVAMEKYLARNWFCCGVIGLFTVLLWGQTVRYGFVWDDKILISQNKSIRSFRNLPEIFTSINAQSAEAAPSFRPTRTAFYALLYAIEGQPEPQPWLFHLANVLWHAVAAMLLFSVALLLCQRVAGEGPAAARITAWLIALGFAAHPVVSEVVCWAKCMDDLMAGVFVLASARSLLKWNEGGRGYVAALVWFFLAAFSKESAVPFAGAVFFLLLGAHKLPRRRSARLTIPFLLVALFYVVWRRCVLGQTSQCPPLSGTYGQTLIDMFPVAPEYLRLFFGIPPFCADYFFMVLKPPHLFLSVGVLEGVFLVLLFSALASWMWRRPHWRMAAFGFFWIALFLLPVSNLVPMMQYMAERFLYLPLMGFLFALGGVFLNLSRLRLAAAVAASAIVVIWAGTSLNRMGVWHDELDLFVRTELEHPGITRVETNAVVAILQLPQMAELQTGSTLSPAQAEQIKSTLQAARRIYPENGILTAELGLTESRIGRQQEALWWLELAVRQNPDSAERWYELASVYRQARQPAKAREACTHALQLDPKFEPARQLQVKLENDMKPASTPK
jgi:protein O-mannosyl-transferase